MWKCPNGCAITEVVASLPTEFDPDSEMQVMVDAETGKATNHFWDGITGVPVELGEFAEEDEQPMCPECQSECAWDGKVVLYVIKEYDTDDCPVCIGGKVTLDSEEEATEFRTQAQVTDPRIKWVSEPLKEWEYIDSSFEVTG